MRTRRTLALLFLLLLIGSLGSRCNHELLIMLPLVDQLSQVGTVEVSVEITRGGDPETAIVLLEAGGASTDVTAQLRRTGRC